MPFFKVKAERTLVRVDNGEISLIARDEDTALKVASRILMMNSELFKWKEGVLMQGDDEASHIIKVQLLPDNYPPGSMAIGVSEPLTGDES